MTSRLTRLCIWLIRRLNRTKDNSLARELHELAGEYMTRPQDGWMPPLYWECWYE